MRDLNSHTILIVEDDDPIRNLYEIKFSQQGYNVISAMNGLDGYEKAKQTVPDIILLDLRMPVMSGDEMLAKLRATEWGCDIRVIILTNISKSEAPMSLRYLHVDRYVTKVHHTPSQIVDVVREVLA